MLQLLWRCSAIFMFGLFLSQSRLLSLSLTKKKSKIFVQNNYNDIYAQTHAGEVGWLAGRQTDWPSPHTYSAQRRRTILKMNLFNSRCVVVVYVWLLLLSAAMREYYLVSSKNTEVRLLSECKMFALQIYTHIKCIHLYIAWAKRWERMRRNRQYRRAHTLFVVVYSGNMYITIRFEVYFSFFRVLSPRICILFCLCVCVCFVLLWLSRLVHSKESDKSFFVSLSTCSILILWWSMIAFFHLHCAE